MTDQRKLLSPVPRSCIRNQSQEDLLKRTKIVLALPSYNRQRLSGIRRGWCPSRPQGARKGDPFRLWRCSPPVVKCAGFIGGSKPSQGETTAQEAPLAPAESALRADSQSALNASLRPAKSGECLPFLPGYN